LADDLIDHQEELEMGVIDAAIAESHARASARGSPPRRELLMICSISARS
jgi:hypothetical protein